MKIKTSELTGPALDWAVAKCEGRMVLQYIGGGLLVNGRTELGAELELEQGFNYMWHPSSNWAQAGPIIERERVELCSYSNEGVDTAFKSKADERGNYSHEEEYVVSVPEVITWTAWVKCGNYRQDGPTLLIAAMRCFIASRLGDEIDVPEELK